MGGRFPVRDRARDNNHRREITMLIFVAPQGVVWHGVAGPAKLGGPTYQQRAGAGLTVINDHESGPSTTPTPSRPPPHSLEINITRLEVKKKTKL